MFALAQRGAAAVLALAALATVLACTTPALAVSGGGKDFSGIDVSGQSFADQQLVGKEFRGSKAKGTIFKGANLAGASLSIAAYLGNPIIDCSRLSKKTFRSRVRKFTESHEKIHRVAFEHSRELARGLTPSNLVLAS